MCHEHATRHDSAASTHFAWQQHVVLLQVRVWQCTGRQNGEQVWEDSRQLEQLPASVCRLTWMANACARCAFDLIDMFAQSMLSLLAHLQQVHASDCESSLHLRLAQGIIQRERQVQDQPAIQKLGHHREALSNTVHACAAMHRTDDLQDSV